MSPDKSVTYLPDCSCCSHFWLFERMRLTTEPTITMPHTEINIATSFIRRLMFRHSLITAIPARTGAHPTIKRPTNITKSASHVVYPLWCAPKYTTPVPAAAIPTIDHSAAFTSHGRSAFQMRARTIGFMPANDRVERPDTMPVPRPDAAHDAPRSARTRC